MSGLNSIIIVRHLDEFEIRGVALYSPETDRWRITVTDHYGKVETRIGRYAWSDLAIMISHAINSSHVQRTELAGLIAPEKPGNGTREEP
jgi:hypothetical protein